MRIFTKVLLLTVFSVFVVSSQGKSAVNPDKPFHKKGMEMTKLKVQSGEYKTAYTVYVPGKEIAPGKFTPAKVHNIPLVPKEYYLPQSIHIKTKKKVAISKNAKAFLSSMIQNAIADLGIESVKAPFAKYVGGNMQAADKFGISRIYEVNYTAPVDPYDVCKELMKNPDVEYAVPIFIYHTKGYKPNDPRYFVQWALKTLKMEDAWDITKGDKEITIAIVDSGTDWEHEDLSANIWTNPLEIPDNNIDDDGNGKIDDIHGWDLCGNVTQGQISTGQWQEDNNPKNLGSFHGTHTAGCASAVTDNDIGVASPGFNCSIIPVKCTVDDAQLAQGIYRGYEGIVYAANLGANIINCSWGGPGYSPAGQDIINQAEAMGSLVVVSAGNESSNNDVLEKYPADYDGCMSVGASSASDRPSNMSNWGLSVQVYSPGEGIMSTMTNDNYANESGTSMSSPIAAGVAALVKCLHRDWTPKQIIHQIRSTSDNVLVPNNPELRPYYYGRINGYKAVYYNLNDSTPTIPGVAVSNLTFQGNDAFVNYDPLEVTITLKNYLSDSKDLTARVLPLDPFVKVNSSPADLGVVANMDTKSFNATVQLDESDPWYYGNARFVIEVVDGNYTDYLALTIPIRLPSENKFTNLNVSVNSQFYPLWHSSYSPKKNTFWSVGESQTANASLFMRYGPNGYLLNSTGQDILYCIFAHDENRAFAGTGPQNQNPVIYSTTDGGQSWTTTNVSNITAFVNEIKFYDEQNGIFLADPNGIKSGIGKTTDGGETWTEITGLPAWQANETGYVGCIAYYNDWVWFGTSRGRVYRSPDRGENWEVANVNLGGHVTYIAFKNRLEGMCVYTKTADLQNSERLIAYTSDGGATWDLDRYSTTNHNEAVVYLFSPYPSDIICKLNSAGELSYSDGDGSSWKPILGYQYFGAIDAAPFIDNDNCRLFYPSRDGTTFSYLDFKFNVFVSVDESVEKNNIILKQNMPNPFSDKTIVSYTLPKAGNVELSIYNMMGTKISSLRRGWQTAGEYEVPVSAENLRSGMYFFSLTVNNTSLNMKFIVNK